MAGMEASFNDFVLETALQRGWITQRQLETVQSARHWFPDVCLADLLYEQQLIGVEQRDWLFEAYQAAKPEAGGGHKESEARPEAGTGSEKSPEPERQEGEGQEVQESLEILHRYLGHALSQGASTLHLCPDGPLCIRENGLLRPLYEEGFLVPSEAIEPVAKALAGSAGWERLRERGATSFSYFVAGLGRFRGHLFREKRGCHLVFCMPLGKPKTVEELGLPEVVRGFAKGKGQLVLIAGPPRSGRTTTLAALLEEINQTRACSLVTVEDPLELSLQPKQALIAQKEVGVHHADVASGIEAALQEDADVLAIGELLDAESLRLALEAADRGLLVLSTTRGSSVVEVLSLLNCFFAPHGEGELRLVQRLLAELLGGIVCQRLVPCRDAARSVLALEILLPTPRAAQCIAAGELDLLPEVLRENRALGMRLMEDSLAELSAKGLVCLDDPAGGKENSPWGGLAAGPGQEAYTL
jgi:twitching motility protein PilT